MSQNNSKTKETLFSVANILKKKIMNGKPYYYIEWEGYPLSEATWEPLKNLQHCIDLVNDFEQKLNKSSPLKKVEKKKKIKKVSWKDIREASIIKLRKAAKLKFNDEFFIYGSFKEGDKAKRIIFAKKDEKNKRLLCAVEWEKRDHGFQPKSTFYSNDEIKKYDPKILVDYYESKLQFLN